MIIYGCITNELNKEGTEDILPKHANQLLTKWNNTKIITRIWKCRIEEKIYEEYDRVTIKR